MRCSRPFLLSVVFFCGVGLILGCEGWILETPGAVSVWARRGYDCGPEPSLRTAPSSSSLAPEAPAFGFRRAHLTPRLAHTDTAPGSQVLNPGGRRGYLRTWHFCGGRGIFKRAGHARQKPAARAAFFWLTRGRRVPGGAARFSKALRMDGNDLRASGLEKRIAKRAGSLACRERTRWREKREKRKTVEKPKSKSRAPQKHRKPHDCLGAAQALATRKPVPTAPPTTAPQRRWAHQKTTLHHRAAHPNHLQRHKRSLRPPARPQWAALQVSCPAHRSSSAPSQDARSPSVGRTRWRAISMRPRESEGSRRRTRMTTGKSERSGPQSWAPAIGSARPRGDLRSAFPPPTSPSYSNFPGFIIPLGSKTRLISRINRNSTASLLCRKCSRFSCPIPCSALMLPP